MNLINNGYVVKKIDGKKYPSGDYTYQGVELLQSWPLRKMNDSISVSLETELWERWLSFTDSIETVNEKAFLMRYAEHCRRMNIDIVILQIESPTEYLSVNENLKIKDILGFDCIVGSELSYLNLSEDFLKTHFNSFAPKLNKYGLFSNESDACGFLEKYNVLIAGGINLENYGTPFPAKLSIAEL